MEEDLGIMEDLDINETLGEKISQLIELNESKAASKDIVEKLDAIKADCDKSVEYRILAGERGAYKTFLDTLSNYKDDKEVNSACLKALLSLMTKQPDLLDDRGISVIISHLQKDVDVEIKKLTLRWAKECCTMHEMNRQRIFDANILEPIKELLSEGNPSLLRETLAVCRILVLDDDVRVEFGRAHEHARLIANETLESFMKLLERFKEDEVIVNEIILTLCMLLVRAEFCKQIIDTNGLDIIKDIMMAFPCSEKVNRQCFKLLKALAGHDQCKTLIIQKKFAPVITAVLESNKKSATIATAGLHCVSALSLRCPENSKVLMEAGIPEVVTDLMRMHHQEKTVQKTASWAIRNMVSRNRTQSKIFLELGVEELLQTSLTKFSDIAYDIKAALRDLDCKVQLNEEWTGKGGALTTGYTFKYTD